MKINYLQKPSRVNSNFIKKKWILSTHKPNNVTQIHYKLLNIYKKIGFPRDISRYYFKWLSNFFIQIYTYCTAVLYRYTHTTVIYRHAQICSNKYTHKDIIPIEFCLQVMMTRLLFKGKGILKSAFVCLGFGKQMLNMQKSPRMSPQWIDFKPHKIKTPEVPYLVILREQQTRKVFLFKRLNTERFSGGVFLNLKRRTDDG